MDIKKAIELIADTPSITGHEHIIHEKIFSLCHGIFDSAVALKNNSVLAVKKSCNKNAPNLLLNAHIDEIGMYVTAIHDNGFISVVNVGGIDVNILASAQVTIYGKKSIKGVFASTPPHLDTSKEKELAKITSLVIDTGLSKKELEEIVEIGTPVGFDSAVDYLLNDCVSCKGMDDRICIISIIKAVEMLKKPPMFNIYALFSSQEEVTSLGAATGVYGINPDIALVVDVGHAKMRGIEKIGALTLGKGTAVSYSATTSRKLSDEICRIAQKNNIDFQRVSEANYTGTDAHNIQIALEGIPTTVLSIPLRNMHTPYEIISLSDVVNTSKLISEFINSSVFCGEEVHIVERS